MQSFIIICSQKKDVNALTKHGYLNRPSPTGNGSESTSNKEERREKQWQVSI